ncbi:MAG: HNH endonuclease [Candidatus Eisenbacteria bacterium]|uniref:HNH endonuclease n=1 Tax=Eiseniibacteriota bacterium TaxID=2212470 RepID=A0A956LY57_UNCEI|nr:HNH endonuclease [Candidatus Eisenbacteria bacterium]
MLSTAADLSWIRSASPFGDQIRETSPPYGPSSRSTRAVVDDLVARWQTLARAESAVALAEGDALRPVLEQRIYRRLGYASFHDYCVEAVEMTPSTAKRRVALSRLADGVPAVRAALCEGRLSPCQALAIRPVVDAENATWWITLAARSTVSELHTVVRQIASEDAAAAAAAADDRSVGTRAAGAGDDGTRTAGGRETGAGETVGADGAGIDDLEVDGRRVSFEAPVAARLAFEEGLRSARLVLGYEAPRHACVAAMLAEASSSAALAPATSPVEPSFAEPDALPADPREQRIQRDLRDRLHRDARARLTRDLRARPSAPEVAVPFSGSDTHVGSAARDHAEGSADGSPEEVRSEVTPFVSEATPEAIGEAEDTLADVDLQLEEFAELLAEAPTPIDTTFPATFVERIEEIRTLAAPIRVLALRVLLHLEELAAPLHLGLPSHESMAVAVLHLAPRTHRALRSEARQLRRRPDLREAFLEGLIGASKLGLLRSIERGRSRAWLSRARCVTVRQLERELFLREKLGVLRDTLSREASARGAECDDEQPFLGQGGAAATATVPATATVTVVGVAGVHPGSDAAVSLLPSQVLDPLPLSGLDVRLVRILRQHGWTDTDLRTHLVRPGVCTDLEADAVLAAAAHATAAHDAAAHASAHDDAVLAAAHASAHAAAAHASTHDDAVAHDAAAHASAHAAAAHASTHDAEHGGADGQRGEDGHARSGYRNDGPGGCASGGGEHAEPDLTLDLTLDPAACPPLMRRLELLVDLALLAVCDDAVLVGSHLYPRGRQTLDLGGIGRADGSLGYDFCRISFWAPRELREDLDAFLDRVHARVGPLPPWAAFMILVRDAVDTWKRVDPKRKPRWWRIHERDQYLCQPPGCSKRNDLHGHHVELRSRQGSDEMENLVATCYGHHLHSIHEGHLQASGNANLGLRWVLGPKARRGHRPFRTYRGDLRVDT